MMRAWLVVAALGLLCSWVQPAQAQTTDVDQRWVEVVNILANPCSGVLYVMRSLGVSPLGPNPRMRLARQNAWDFVFPVLAWLATDPATANDPNAVMAALQDSLQSGLTYSAQQANEALPRIEAAAQRGMAALQSDAPSESVGVLLLGALWSDPDRVAAWRTTVLISGLPSSVRDGLRRSALQLYGPGAALTQCSQS